MAFSDTVRGLWLLNGDLEDSVSNNDFVSSDYIDTYENYQSFNLFTNSIETKQGLQFLSGRYFSAGNNFASFMADGNYDLAIAFWYVSPTALGLTRHAITRKNVPLEAPIIAKADTITVAGLESITSGEWIITEIGVSKTQNAIRIYFCESSSTVSHIFESLPYTPGKIHVFINYSSYGSFGVVKIDINGKQGFQFIGPNNISDTSSDITLNKVGFGYTAHKTTQSGAIISELIIKNKTIVSFKSSSNIMALGWEYFADSTLDGRKASYLGIGYNQQTTITTNQIYTDGRNIYSVRSNGEILKGYQPIWDTEADYTQETSGSKNIFGNTIRI